MTCLGFDNGSGEGGLDSVGVLCGVPILRESGISNPAFHACSAEKLVG